MKIKNILEATNGKLIQGNEETEITNFCKDTRIIKKGDTYIGIKGENFDWGFNGKIGVEFSQIQLFCGYELGMKEVWIWPENAKNRSIVFGVGYIF